MSSPSLTRAARGVTAGMSYVVAAALVATALVAPPAHAQVLDYPSLQLPTASTRDYTAALVGGSGTTAVFQWREGWGARQHLQLDLGLADRKGSKSLLLLVGGSLGRELVRATGDQPLDMLFTVGAGAAFGDGSSLIRVPVGLSIGHSFELDRGMSLTPYVHPRASLDLCSSCGSRTGSRSELSLNFDVGVNFQVNREFALRVAGVFSGSDLLGMEDTFGIGFNWTPKPLLRVRGQ